MNRLWFSVAAIATFGLGAVWYSALFAKAWKTGTLKFQFARMKDFLPATLIRAGYTLLKGHASMAVCHLTSSVMRKSGNLEVYYCGDEKRYARYALEKQQWQQKELPRLTDREKDILKLAKQGRCSKEIANMLHTSGKTIRNQEAELYRKLDVHSMLEAVIFATNHKMIYVQTGFFNKPANRDKLPGAGKNILRNFAVFFLMI